MNLTKYNMFAVSPPGLEQVVLRELTDLGITGGRMAPGGVEFSGGLDALYQANLWLRSASRVLVRVVGFRAVDFKTVVEKVGRYPWELYLHHTDMVKIRVTTHACRLYHTGALAERVLAGLERRLGRDIMPDSGHSDIEHSSQALLVLRGSHDRFQLSVDSTGPHLHKRGYREAHSRASIRENLAAGILLLAGWAGKEALLDPFCGAGTIPIEAAMLARGIAPGIHRHFAFELWKNHDPGLWAGLRKEAASMVRPVPDFPVMGSDISARAISVCAENAERAGVSDAVRFDSRPVAEVPRMSPPGLLITNPPYGKRVRAAGGESVYAQLDRLLAHALSGWRWAVLSPGRPYGRMRKKSRNLTRLSNGGIRVMLRAGP